MARSGSLVVVGLFVVGLTAHVAGASPPSGYRCGKGGKAKKAEQTCQCPRGKVGARDAKDRAVCAAPPKQPRLTVVKLGDGVVTSSPAGIDCGADCSEGFAPGTSVVLTATGAGFVGWTGGGCGFRTTCTTTIRQAGTVTATFATTIGVGSEPSDVFFDGTSVWVASTGDRSTSKIDPATGAVVATLAGAAGPMAFDGQSLWIADGQTLSKVDPATGTVTASVGGFAGTRGLAFDGANLWVTDGADAVARIDPTSATVTATVTGFDDPAGIAFDGTHLWIANSLGATVSRLDPKTATITGTATGVHDPHGVAFDGVSLWITGIGVTWKLDPRSFTSSVVLRAGGSLEFDGASVWGADASDDALYRLDPATGQAVRFGGVASPLDVAFDGRDLWVTNFEESSVTRIANASSRPPTGYDCGKGKADPARETCACGKGKLARRDADDRAVCVAKPKPSAKQPLTVATVGTGAVTSSPAGIACGDRCTRSYKTGTRVTLTATAGEGTTFAGWSGGGCVGTGTCTVTASAALTVTAAFTKTIAVGTGPTAMAFDGKSLWVANTGGGTLSKLDPTTETITATGNNFGTPAGMAFDGTYLWVANTKDDRLSKIDLSNDSVVARFGPLHLRGALLFDGASLWYTHGGDPESWAPIDGLSRYDPVGDRLADYSDASFYLPGAMAFDGTCIWLSVQGTSEVMRIDPASGTLTALSVASPGAMVFDGTSVWVASDDTVVRIDATTVTVTATVAVDYGLGGLAFDGTDVWVAGTSGDTVSRIDRKTNTVTATAAGFSGPSDLAFDGTDLWVSNATGNSVSRWRP